MIDVSDRWVWAVGAIVAGVLLGALLGLAVRRWLGGEARRPAVRSIAGAASTFLFWICASAGVILAIGATSPENLEPLPRDLIQWFPNALIAGLLVLAGWAAGIAVSTTVGAALSHATGAENRAAERTIRWAITGGALVLALGQLGVETTIIMIVVGGIVFAASGAFVLLTGLGGRAVAQNIAIGRSLRSELHVGDRLDTEAVAGVIVRLNPTTVVVEVDRGRETVVPYAHLLDGPFSVESSGR